MTDVTSILRRCSQRERMDAAASAIELHLKTSQQCCPSQWLYDSLSFSQHPKLRLQLLILSQSEHAGGVEEASGSDGSGADSNDNKCCLKCSRASAGASVFGGCLFVALTYFQPSHARHGWDSKIQNFAMSASV